MEGKKNTFVFLVLIVISISSCVGNRTAKPIDVIQKGDFDKNCQSIQLELDFIVRDLKLLIPEASVKWKFVSLSTMGGLYEFPWVHLADGSAEQSETKALSERYARLVEIAEIKECDIDVAAIPEI